MARGGRVTFEVIPAIDLRGGRVVRLRRGDFGQETSYGEDPSAVATLFANAGARWLHVVDLDGARDGVPTNREAIAGIVAAAGERAGAEVAGGLRTSDDVAAAFAAGAARVVVGTAALRDPIFAGDLVAAFGEDRIVAAIDVRDGRAVGEGWRGDAQGPEAGIAVAMLADHGITTFEVTAISRDGLLEGPDLDLLAMLVAIDRGAVIASGGVSSLADLRAVADLGCVGAIVGRAIYEGRIELPEAVALAATFD
jgi:phosphoribosylformimino-5-aminoimidazole carboxamide ribotide isomerase